MVTACALDRHWFDLCAQARYPSRALTLLNQPKLNELGVSHMRQKLVVGNWKMNGASSKNDVLLIGVTMGVKNFENVGVAVCPPACYLIQAGRVLAGSNVVLGAQNMNQHEQGAYTGEISADMLQDFNCEYVILGHSERRQYFAETDAAVAEKTVTAVNSGIAPIVCVGETLEEREAGQAFDVIGKQLGTVLNALSVEQLATMVVAYEPVWAIGTGKTASPEQAQEVHAFIRAQLAEKDADAAQATQILYGGSVKPDNAAELFSMQDIDGGLIGGASLKANQFVAICAAAQQ